eukprot:1370615-Rhodomonas_salina.1
MDARMMGGRTWMIDEGRMVGWMNRRMVEWRDECKDHGWTEGRPLQGEVGDGWMDSWMDG